MADVRCIHAEVAQYYLASDLSARVVQVTNTYMFRWNVEMHPSAYAFDVMRPETLCIQVKALSSQAAIDALQRAIGELASANVERDFVQQLLQDVKADKLCLLGSDMRFRHEVDSFEQHCLICPTCNPDLRAP